MTSFDDSSELVRFATQANNLYNALYWEVAWKNHSLRTDHYYLDALLNNKEAAREICTETMINLVGTVARECRGMPKVLDIGCGPVSSLAHLAHEHLADVLGLDPLAEEYADLLSRYGKTSPVKQEAVHAEFLDEAVSDCSFDICHVRNALDHTQSPCLTWLNIFRATKVGGYIVQSHSIREATKEQWKQLHQFDLYPDTNGHLWLEDAFGTNVCLSSSLPLSVVTKATNLKDDGHGWSTTIFRKMSDEWRVASFLDMCLRQLKLAFRKRSNHAMELERYMVKELEAQDGTKYPYKADIKTRA